MSANAIYLSRVTIMHIQKLYGTMDAHQQRVESITIQVQAFYNNKQRLRIYHGSTSSTRQPVGASTNTVDTSRLNSIIEVNSEDNIAVVESNVPMDALLERTLKDGLMPLVVTEFPGITVGGAYSGTAGESSSFKHSFFDRTVSKIEMVLANGEVVMCSEDENQDVFRAAPGALGTLGVVTLLHVRLQQAARYVEVTYHQIFTIAEALEKFQQLAQEESGFDYLDGIMFSPTQGAVITGRLRDFNPTGLPVQRFSRAKDPWYFMHVEQCVSKSAKPHSELIPLPDYIFRYNRGCFWCGKSVFDLIGLRFSRSTRRILDFMLRTRMLYKALHAQSPTTLMLIQDLAMPSSAAEEFAKWQEQRLGIWPLWLCPLSISPMPTLHPHPLKTGAEDKYQSSELMLNIGLYGVSPRNYEEWVTANRDLEDKVAQLGGMKWAYAAQLYSEKQFWQQYDREWYDKLRERCHATALPDIYEKTTVDVEAGRKMIAEGEEYWKNSPFAALVELRQSMSCVWSAVKSRAWKLERHGTWKRWPKD